MQPLLYKVIISISILHSSIPYSMQTRHHHGSETDQQALWDIKSKISWDPNRFLSSWNESLPVCEWQGITCGRRHRRVVRLDLSSTGLVGTLSPSVGNLSFLCDLNLHNNTFQGGIPSQIGHLRRLRKLFLGSNEFEGEIPANLSRCLRLTKLLLDTNKLTGRVPGDLSSLPNLLWFGLSKNTLSGELQSTGITNMTSLEKLTLDGNRLEGSIPHDIGQLKGLITLFLGQNRLSDVGLLLPRLQFLQIRNNYLSGSVLGSLSNLSELVELDISNNNFTGKFMFSGKNMQKLEWISMESVFIWGDIANDFSFLETLTNCSSLQYLEVGLNGFGGFLPNAIVNLSTTLRYIDVQNNRISGILPLGISKYVNLVGLLLNDNQFTGPIPADIGELKNLQTVFFDFNNLSGNIPPSFGNLSLLSIFGINNNNLVGHIPSSLGNCKNLLRLYLSENHFSGVVPPDLFHASELVELVIGENNLQGSLPNEISNLKNLVTLDVSDNLFSGEIPTSLGGCTSLLVLYMGGNSFSGSIPSSLSSLKSIQDVDLSYNNFSGQIPSCFSDFPLVSLLLSHNNFEGEVPVKGIFSIASAVSLDGNTKLCGGVPELHLPTCPSQTKLKRRKVSLKVRKIIISTAAAGVLIAALVIALLAYFLYSRRKTKSAPSVSLEIKAFLDVSYQMLWEATEGFSPSNLIGSGGFGAVYKGTILQDDERMQVAVKVMNLQNERANKSLITECKALRNIRHRNLIKIITVCSSIDYQGTDFMALVYEFMPRGSLERWLHSVRSVDEQGDGDHLHCLTLLQRVSIVVDVACAIDYLHNECPTPIIHCDLKPSNILLDDEMTAHVGDFGLAKFLLGASGTGNHTSLSQVRGTIGYTAPEYGLGSKVSAEGDTYSFGIIILEMMTAKKPTDPMFIEGLNLRDYTKSALPSQMREIIDPSLIEDDRMWIARNNADIRKTECMKSLINIGIQCCLELPQDRMHMKEVVNQLKSAKENLVGRRT